MSAASSIDEKKNQKNTESNKISNWVAFGISVLQNFILVLFIGVLGSNFIFLSNCNATLLEKLLPTNETSYFPVLAQKGGNDGEDGDSSLQSFGIGSPGGWPYKYRDLTAYGFSVGGFLNWLIITIYGAFSFNRGLLKSWLGFFSKDKSFLGNNTLQILIIAPITLMASILAFPAGFFVGLFKSFTTKMTFGLVWAIVGLFLGYSSILLTGISIVQFIQYLIFFMIIPLIVNLKQVKTILHRNITTLGMLFGALVCSSAITTLDYVTSSVMVIGYILMAIKTIW